jgi:hypothetical protein
VPEQNKKLAGFEALYQVDQEKRQRSESGTPAADSVSPATKDAAEKPERTRAKVSKSESNIVSNMTNRSTDVFEPTTFKADRRKVKSLKRLALDLEPPRKLQDLFDEALTDLLNKYGRTVE